MLQGRVLSTMPDTKPYEPYPDRATRLGWVSLGVLLGVLLVVIVSVATGNLDRDLLIALGVASVALLILIGSLWLWIFPIATSVMIWVYERDQAAAATRIATTGESSSAGTESLLSLLMTVRLRASLTTVMGPLIGVLVGLVVGNIWVLLILGLGMGVALATIDVAMWFFFRSRMEARGLRW